MKIGLIGAMDEEIAFLLKKLSDPQEIRIANTSFIKGKLYNKKVVLLKSGIGKVNAAMSTTILHERFSPTYVLNTGSAGGFADGLVIGDVVISEEIVHHDVDATAFGYRYGQVPQMPVTYKGNPDLIQLAKRAVQKTSIEAKTGLIATGDTFMEDSKRVKLIKEQFPQMLAADMESAAIAQVCYQYDKPFVVIRALSDIAGEKSSVSFDSFVETAAKNAGHILVEMVKNL